MKSTTFIKPLIQRTIKLSISAAIVTFAWGSKSYAVKSKPDADPVKIVILGDSLTEGYGIEKEQAFPALVEKSLNELGYKVKIVNGGISGSTSASAPSRAKWFLKSQPQYLLITLGSNDGLRGVAIESLKQNLKTSIQLAKQQNVKVWLAGLKMPPNYGREYTEKFESVFSDVAKEESIPLLPFLLEGVAGNPKLNQPDAIHPNEKGHEEIARRVVEFIRKQIKK